MEGLQEAKEDPLLGLDDGWKHWLRPVDDQGVQGPYPVNCMEAVSEEGIENEESKEEIVVSVDAADITGIRTAIKEEPSYAEECFDDEFKEENHPIKKELCKNNSALNSQKYGSVLVKSYSSVTVKEEPVEEISKIFEETPLDVEKRKFHQQIFNEVMEDCNEKTFDSLQQEYIVRLREVANIEIFKCASCNYQTMNIANLKSHLFLIHKRGSLKVKMYKCFVCTYKSKSLACIKRHECESCDFRTDQKKSSKVHALTHKNPDELQFFFCNVCDFKTKNKPYLKVHSLVHKNPDEIEKKYMCEICSKKFRVRSKLHFHLLTHKTNDEVELFSCSECDYKTKLKYNLKIHKKIHQEPSFACDTCGLQSRRKWNHEMHLLTHKNNDEVQIFKCALCAYQTKFKDRLKRHLAKQTHFGNKKITVRRQRRSKITSGPSDPVVKVKKRFICDVCGIKCSQKGALKTHSLKHKKPDEIKMHSCDQCGYETRIKGNLTNHLKIHKDPSEFPTFKCDTCGLVSKNKWNHKRHVLTHKNSAECELYSCTICSYQTKFREYLREHFKKRHNINIEGKPGRPPVNSD